MLFVNLYMPFMSIYILWKFIFLIIEKYFISNPIIFI